MDILGQNIIHCTSYDGFLDADMKAQGAVGEGEIYAANQDTIVEQDNDEIKLLKKRIEELEAWNWSLLKLAKLLDKQLEEIKNKTK